MGAQLDAQHSDKALDATARGCRLPFQSEYFHLFAIKYIFHTVFHLTLNTNQLKTFKQIVNAIRQSEKVAKL